MAEDLNSLFNNHDRRLRNLETRQVRNLQGVQGISGAYAAQGIQGRTGIQGPSGYVGSDGAQGIQGTTGAVGAGGAIGYYGAFSDYNDHFSGVGATGGTAVANTAAAFTFGSTDEANGVSITTNGGGLRSRVTFANVGTYNIQFSVQLSNSNNAPQDVYIWFKKNGTDVVGSTGRVGLPARKNPGDPFHAIYGWNFVFTTTSANDYYEFYWSTSSTDVSIQYYSIADNGSPTKPSTASIVLTATQVTYAIQGTQGLQGLQGLNGAYAAQGIQGRQGLQGTTGIQGLQGSYFLQSTTPPTGSTVGIGSAWYDPTTAKTYIYDGSFWVETGSAPIGAQGVQGTQGTQGLQGIQGVQGVQGVSFVYYAPNGDVSLQGTSSPLGTITSTDVTKIFGVGASLLANTTYDVDIFAMLNMTTDGTGWQPRISTTNTSLTLYSYNFYTELFYNLPGAGVDTSLQAAVARNYRYLSGTTTVSNSTLSTGVLTANTYYSFKLIWKGIIRTNAAGTWTPNFLISAGSATTAVLKSGSYIRLTPITTGTASPGSIGTWS